MAGKFHWNGNGIHWNDQNPTGICGASVRPPWCGMPAKLMLGIQWIGTVNLTTSGLTLVTSVSTPREMPNQDTTWNGRKLLLVF